ncbi:uncharacterized protein LOC144368470 isoform X1 [Ictidomys tridecemlineatus]
MGTLGSMVWDPLEKPRSLCALLHLEVLLEVCTAKVLELELCSSPRGGWVLHHPPALFPPCGPQNRIQHHGQLPDGSCSAAQAGLKLTILLPQPPGSLGLRACSTLSYVEDRSGCRGQELQAQEAERNAQKGAPSWELPGGRGSQSCAGPVPGSLPDNPQCQGLLKGP